MPAERRPTIKKPEVKKTVTHVPGGSEHVIKRQVHIIDQTGVKRTVEVHHLPPEVRRIAYETNFERAIDLRKVTLTKEQHEKLKNEWTW